MDANPTLDALGIGTQFQDRLRSFWTKNALKLDIPVIDLQHIWLVYLIMDLESEMDSKDKDTDPQEKIRKILGDLLSFAAEHFSTEENMLMHYEVPENSEHIEKHRHFVQFLSERTEEFKKGKTESIRSLVSFLKDWLTMHIQKDDRNYAEHFRDAGINPKLYFQQQLEKHTITIDRGQVAVYRLVSESDEVREIVNENITSNVIKIWNANNLSIHIPIIDLQHIWLISLIVELDLSSRSRNMATGAREKIFNRVVNGAMQYAQEHFYTEERIMEKFKFSELANHLRQHHSFREFVARRAQEAKSGEPQAAVKLVNDLREWLLSHIAIEDRKIHLQLKGHLTEIQAFVRDLINTGEIKIRKKQIDLYNQVYGLQKV